MTRRRHQQKVRWLFTNISRSTYWFIISRLQWSNCSSVKLAEKRLYLSLSSPFSPSVMPHFLSLSLPCFQATLLLFLGSVLPGLCSVAQFCLRLPGTSPLSVFSLFPLRLLSLSLSPSLHPNPYQEREREAILNPAQYFFCFLSTGASRSKSIYTFQEVIHWKDTYLVFANERTAADPLISIISLRGDKVSHCMAACCFAKVKVVLSGRPNSLTKHVQGTFTSSKFLSFIVSNK